LEKLLEKPASDEKEKGHREGLSMYAKWFLFGLDTETLLVNSKILKSNCSRCAGSLRFCDLSIIPTTAKMSTNFSKTYERLSATTWFVRGCETLLNVDRDNRWYNKWRFTIKGVSGWWVPPISFLEKWNNFPRQSAGRDVLYFGDGYLTKFWQPKNL